MITVKVNVKANEVTGLIRRLNIAFSGNTAGRVVGEACADTTRDHFLRLAGERHRPGLPRNYYLRAADAVVSEPINGGARVSVAHTGLALRYHGGTVLPSGRISLVTGRPIRALAVPVGGSEAEGKTPGEFQGLFVLSPKKSDKAVLADRAPDGMVRILFRLIKKSHHTPDPSVLPSDSDYEKGATSALEELVQEIKHG